MCLCVRNSEKPKIVLPLICLDNWLFPYPSIMTLSMTHKGTLVAVSICRSDRYWKTSKQLWHAKHIFAIEGICLIRVCSYLHEFDVTLPGLGYIGLSGLGLSSDAEDFSPPSRKTPLTSRSSLQLSKAIKDWTLHNVVSGRSPMVFNGLWGAKHTEHPAGGAETVSKPQSSQRQLWYVAKLLLHQIKNPCSLVQMTDSETSEHW